MFKQLNMVDYLYDLSLYTFLYGLIFFFLAMSINNFVKKSTICHFYPYIIEKMKKCDNIYENN